MGDLTFLRILVIVSFVHTNVFPWWVWLWAILVEGDHLLNSFVDYRCNSLMMKEFERNEQALSSTGNNPTTPV